MQYFFKGKGYILVPANQKDNNCLNYLNYKLKFEKKNPPFQILLTTEETEA